MTIKSIQTLVSDAMSQIKTINADDAFQMVENKDCNFIDIRELNELENAGRVEGASHIPRGMLEVYLDPNSALFKNGIKVGFCKDKGKTQKPLLFFLIFLILIHSISIQDYSYSSFVLHYQRPHRVNNTGFYRS